MTIPSLIFAFLIASLYGAVYHLIRDGGLGQLILYLILGWLGFALGHLTGIWQGWILFPLGPLNLGMSTLGSLLFLLMGDWLSHFNTDSQPFSDGENGV